MVNDVFSFLPRSGGLENNHYIKFSAMAHEMPLTFSIRHNYQTFVHF